MVSNMEEKTPLLGELSDGSPAEQPALRQCRRRSLAQARDMLIILLLIGAVTWSFFCVIPFTQKARNQAKIGTPTYFNWSSIPSSPQLEYSKCYGGGFQCARLELPMDYWNHTTDETISLAIIRKPAAVPVTDERYGGPILFNPGGPGGSGIGLLLGGRGFEKIVDANTTDGKFYDLVSFDPRGVGETRPAAICSEDPVIAQSFALRVMEEGILGSSDASLGRLWSMSQARSQSCSLPPKEGADIKRYLSTAYVATDMLEIVEAHGAWREREAKKLLRYPLNALGPALRYKKGREKIQYWGFSYGSYLGMTFAAMYPDRIHRLIVDGVVDAYDYKKTLWYDNLVDTENDMDLLYYHCARVGYPKCALANQTGETTAAGVKQRVLNITQSLYHSPLPVIGPYPEVIEYSDIKNLIFLGLYSPIQSFPAITDLLADVEKGNGTKFAQLLRPQHSFYCPVNQPGDSGRDIRALNNDAQTAIACTDGDDQSFLDKAHFVEHFKRLDKLSPSVGAIWSTIRMQCVHFTTRAQHRFEGPWFGNTSHPILLMGNTADPVTPVRNAVKMAKGFKNAVALTQDSAGHCTLSAPSKCTIDYVRRYFQTGELPPKGAFCEADEVPFGSTEKEGVYNAEAAEFKAEIEGLHAALRSAQGGPMNMARGSNMLLGEML